MRFQDIWIQIYRGHDFHLSRSCDVITDVTIRFDIYIPFPIGVPLEPSLYLQQFSRYSAEICPQKLVRTDRQKKHSQTHIHRSKVILYSVLCNVLHWTDNNQEDMLISCFIWIPCCRRWSNEAVWYKLLVPNTKHVHRVDCCDLQGWSWDHGLGFERLVLAVCTLLFQCFQCLAISSEQWAVSALWWLKSICKLLLKFYTHYRLCFFHAFAVSTYFESAVTATSR